jgi:prophage antirepressor-like protein
MNELMTIENVRGYIDENGIAFLNLEDVSRGLGFTQIAKSGNQCVRWERVSSYLHSFGIPTSGDGSDFEFIPENIFYRLAMKANNETAEKFQAKVCDEILPQIRKTGGYKLPQMTQQEILIATLQEQQKIVARVDILEDRINNQMTIPSGKQRSIQKAIAKRVYFRADETDFFTESIEDKKKLRSKYFKQLHREIRDRFGVPSYLDVKEKDFPYCINYINNWIESKY